MAAKKIDLNKRCFFVLSGVSNPLTAPLAVEICRRFKADSTILLIDDSEANLQQRKKELQKLHPQIQIVYHQHADWHQADVAIFSQYLNAALNKCDAKSLELAVILHNESNAATHKLMEPEDINAWLAYVQHNLYAPVALNQAFLQSPQLDGIEKLCINITSSLCVKPLQFEKMQCSCKKARDMYFHGMASDERRNKVFVLNYTPGILDSHEPIIDMNKNLVDFEKIEVEQKWLKIAHVLPSESAQGLIDVVEKIGFYSGHNVDYYDTFDS